MIELIGIGPGARLHVIGGITAEVIEAINDEWVLCHATDVIEVL